MNLHPIFVHFPIAILTIYSISEFIYHKKLLKTDFWFYFKAILVILGVITALVALQTGEFMVQSENILIQKHKYLANNTILIFGLIALFYGLVGVDKTERVKLNYGTILEKLWRKITKFSRFVLRKRWLIILIAIVGFISLIITGALGGAVAYGVDVNPLSKIISKLFVRD